MMKTVGLPGLVMHVEERGNASGVPVLLLHGLGSTGGDWESVAPLLATHHRLIIPDIRGHGRTEKPSGDYSIPLFANDVAALCEKLEVARVHVVGLSMGGMIAFQLLASRPDLVESLTVINSGPDMTPKDFKMRFALGLRLFLLRALGPRRFAAVLSKRLFPKPDQEALRRTTVERLGANAREVYLRCTRALLGWNVSAELPRMRAPVLILAGDRDYTPVAMKQAYAARLEDARVEVLADTGHAAPAEQPQLVARKILEFIDRVRSSSTRRPSSPAVALRPAPAVGLV